MKTCPFCAEDVQDAAELCKHCGKRVVPRQWFTRAGLAAIIVLLCVVIVAMARGSGPDPLPPPVSTAPDAASTRHAH